MPPFMPDVRPGSIMHDIDFIGKDVTKFTSGDYLITGAGRAAGTMTVKRMNGGAYASIGGSTRGACF